jgi:hypothetical protein
MVPTLMPTTPERIRQDRRLIGHTLLKLALPRLALQAVVIAVAIVAWLLVASWIRGFGATISYASLNALGPQTVEFLTRINPYLWWAVVVLWTAIVFVAVKAWLGTSRAAGRMYALDSKVLAQLRLRLSEEVIDVLRWVWNDREEPFTVGDLQRAHQELRSNRIGKIALVRAQSAILDQPVDEEPATHASGEPRARHAEPSLWHAR